MIGDTGKQRTFGILLFPNIESIDCCGPYDVFASARLSEELRRETQSPIRVLLISDSLDPVTAAGGIRILPDVDFASCPPLDVLVVPGGQGTRAAMNDQPYLDFIRKQAEKAERIASLGTGSLVLGAAGLLNGLSATTHWRARDFFRSKFPNTTLERDLRVVVDGQIMTSSSIYAGIDMCLRLVEQYYGEEVAHNVALHMEYAYPENNKGRRAT
ncbi:MAG TPA: DJ-1/PfpI family protein [candidate division Zixibacteria bacterium]|nr:DJ-1/PfpI family protein [candidate division Zixibacteria bacterium]